MAEELLKIVTLFRMTTTVLRTLARDGLKTGGNTILTIEAYLHQDELRTADAFPPDRCLETANLLEEFADKLLAVARSRT
jgi:hypothetical protein